MVTERYDIERKSGRRRNRTQWPDIAEWEAETDTAQAENNEGIRSETKGKQRKATKKRTQNVNKK